MLASLNCQHSLRSVVGLNILKPQHNLLCSVSLFLENRLNLSTIATQLPVITPLPLCIQRLLALLVLCCIVGLMLATLLQKVRRVLGTFTIFARALTAHKKLINLFEG